jgi:hypothetical protein
VHVISTSLRRPWRAVSSVARISRQLRADPGVTFFICGRSSAGNGHRDISRSLSPRRVVAVIEWNSDGEAASGRAALDEHLRQKNAVVWSAALVPVGAHGTWNGQTPFRPANQTPAGRGQVVSLTCARVRLRHMADFYLRAFPALARLARRDDSLMIAGLGFGGALPLRDACTISLWPEASDVDAYAYRQSAHDAVQRRSTVEGWLSQSLFARFVVSDHAGSWAGGDPLAAPPAGTAAQL